MCISIAAKVISVQGQEAKVQVLDSLRNVFVACESVQDGDWVLLNGGLAVGVLSEAEATQTMQLFERLSRVE